MPGVDGLVTFLSSSLGLALATMLWQSLRYRKLEKEAQQREAEKGVALRLKELEFKITDMDKTDTRFEGSLKRNHQRLDDIERSHDKLEHKIEKDLSEVKKSITNLTSLVIQALQRGDTK